MAKIENNTVGIIHLPPTSSFPSGIALLPGIGARIGSEPETVNNVPDKYMDELKALTRLGDYINQDTRTGDRHVIKVGENVLAELTQPTMIVTPDGKRRGPRITVYADDACPREDGFDLPQTLDELKPEVALKFIEATSNKEALKRWTKTRNKQVANAAQAKLSGG